jgi:hypothetical protein
MTARQRILAFGSTAILFVAGLACEVAARNVTAEAVGIALMLIGSLGLVMLVFLEVGLSEEHDRARDEARRAAAAAPRHPPRRLRRPPRRRRPG